MKKLYSHSQRLICLFILTFLGYHLQAQGIITGKVTDTDGAPLTGATVILNGTSRGALTDQEGTYQISTPLGEQTLTVSYTGYSTQSATISVTEAGGFTQDFSLPTDNLLLDEVVVTATFGSRSQKESPLSMTYISGRKLEKLSSNSQADILRTIPGVTAEGGGGEVASNVFIRGMPSGGQYQFTPLQVDGLPVLSTFGLNSSAHDVYFRNDIGLRSLEFVRGGASTLFGAGSVAGIINYTSVTGGPIQKNRIQLEFAQNGRAKFDFLTSGPLAENTFYAISGFYRYDDGPLETGLPTRGYQIRANLKKIFNDGQSSFTLSGQAIDDKVQFYLPYPLLNAGGDRERPNGNDGKTIYTMLTGEARDFSFDTPNGRFKTPIGDGVSTQGGYIKADLNHTFSAGWKLTSKVKAARYDHWFNLFLDGDGTHNTPETQASYLADRELPADATFTYVDTERELAAGDLLFQNRVLDRQRPMDEIVGEINLTKSFNGHNITLGTFLSNTKAEDNNWIWNFVGDFSNSPRMVGITYTDTEGNLVNYSSGGFINGNQTANRNHQSIKSAIYLADEYKGERFNFDIGLRWERAKGLISRETGIGSNTFEKGEVSTSGFAIALAGLLKVNSATNLYANASRGYFFPELRGVRFSTPGEPQSYEAESINQGEIGIKYNQGDLALTGAVFLVALGDRRSVDFVNDGQGGVREEVSVQSTRTFGVEANLTYRLTKGLDLYGNLTLQDHEFTKFEGNESLVGNRLRRQPTIMGLIGIAYDNNQFDFDLSSNFLGNKFANDANTVELDGFNIVRASAGYSIDLGDAQRLRLGLSVFNLLDSDGVTEGSPRQGNAQVGGGQFFVGRPILPRRVFFRATFDF